DPPAEEHDRHRRGARAEPGLAAEIENALTLEKKIALLRVEDVEAREVDLLQVLFDLREIGIHRHVGGERAREAVLQIEAAARGYVVGEGNARRTIRRHRRDPVR